MASCIVASFVLACSDEGSLASKSAIATSGDIYLTENLELRPGEDLELAAGTKITALGNFKITAADGASVRIEGTADNPVVCEREGGGVWGGITVAGGGSLEVRHATVVGAPLVAINGATLIVEDSSLSDYTIAIPAIVFADNAAKATLSRVHVSNYYEIHFVRTPTTIEDCLLEGMIGDGIDFDNSPEGSLIRGCTIRNSSIWNVDGIDFGVAFYPTGESSVGTVEDCLIYDITDKGISVGEGASRVDIKNCLIHHVGIGISAKDNSKVFAQGVTLADSNFGINCYEERGGAGGGSFTGTDMVVLGNLIQVQATDNSSVALGYSGVQARSASMDTTNVVEYINDPNGQFTNRVARDYTLKSTGSLATLVTATGLSVPGYSGAVGATASSVGATDFSPTPVKAAVYGDSRDGSVYHEKIVSRLTTVESPDLVIHTGDMVSSGTDPAQWQLFDDITAPLRKIAPIFPVPGNHEGEAILYYDHFDLPLNDSGNEKWYAVNKENTLFIMLNSNILARASGDAERIAQLAWLESTLAASALSGSGIEFRFVSLHYPLYTAGSASHPDPLVEFPIRDTLALILEDPRWQVDMVFSGHDHFYERRAHNGTEYFVFGGGGAPLQAKDSVEDPDSTAMFFSKSNHYGVLLVDEHTAKIEVKDLDGIVIDSFEVSK